MEPACFSRAVTDSELGEDLAALEAGRCPPWRLTGSARYRATQWLEGSGVLCHFVRVWLETPAGERTVVTLRRLPSSALWQRIDVPPGDRHMAPE